MSASPKAVFLSYARDDAAAARRIAEALRVSGLEVWFDENELRGGDAWDAKIRKQIDECSLFIPIISQHTQERSKGYFRLEWKLAVDQTHLLAAGVPFIAPVVTDDTKESSAIVPPEFMKVQWTRLPGALPTLDLVAQVKRLLEAPTMAAAVGRVSDPPSDHSALEKPKAGRRPALPRTSRLPVILGAIALIAVAGYLVWQNTRPAKSTATATLSSSAPNLPPPASSLSPTAAATAADKSVAVLAFADLSEARNSEYFSDGISEELLNVLAKVPGLRVAARTSAFFFKGKNLPIPEIAEKLNVAYVVEGSVQRAGDRVKITAQLIKATDGFHVWSDTFTREAKDVFAVQEEIAGRIAKELSLKLGVSSAAATAAVNPQAFELYLQGRQAWSLRTEAGYDRAEELLNRALALEPGFARAHAALADVWLLREGTLQRGRVFEQRDSPAMASIRVQIERALALDPNLADAHASLGALFWNSWRLPEAERELRRAVALNPNYATAHQWLGRALVSAGRLEEGSAALHRAAELDPLSHRIVDNQFIPLMYLNRLEEGLAVAERALALQPDSIQAMAWKATALSFLGRREETAAYVRRFETDNSIYNVWAVRALARVGLQEEAEKLYAKSVAARDVGPRYLALAGLGRLEEALTAMTPATLSIQPWNEVLFDPVFDPIRTDPRFVQLLATLGMTEAHARAQAWRKAHPPKKVETKK